MLSLEGSNRDLVFTEMHWPCSEGFHNRLRNVLLFQHFYYKAGMFDYHYTLYVLIEFCPIRLQCVCPSQ